MIKRDYILRMVEMMTEVLAAILGLVKGGELKKASDKLDRAYHDFLSEDAAFFNNIPLEKLTDTLIGEHNYTNSHLEILADLMYAEGEVAYAQNSDRSLVYFKKSEALMVYLDNHSGTFSLDRQSKLAKIKGRIGELGG